MSRGHHRWNDPPGYRHKDSFGTIVRKWMNTLVGLAITAILMTILQNQNQTQQQMNWFSYRLTRIEQQLGIPTIPMTYMHSKRNDHS